MNVEIISSELNFKAVRSSGAGGQNVNKVSSKIVLIFDVATSQGVTDEERILLHTKLKTKISKGANEKRIQEKKKAGEIKAGRKKLDF